MISLGIDPSLTGLGWVVHNDRVVGPNRVVAKGVFSTDPKQITYVRYMALREAVARVLDEHREIAAVGVESPPFGELWSEGLYGLFLYVNEAIVLRRKDVVYFDPLRVKLLAKMDPSVRKGTMDKNDMVDAAKAETGIRSWNHNEADAYIIARSAARFFEFIGQRVPEDELTPAEQKVFCYTHTFVRGDKAGRTLKKGVAFKEDDRFHRFSQLTAQDLALTVADRRRPSSG